MVDIPVPEMDEFDPDIPRAAPLPVAPFQAPPPPTVTVYVVVGERLTVDVNRPPAPPPPPGLNPPEPPPATTRYVAETPEATDPRRMATEVITLTLVL
jgi:hypothetical protein